ncbi:MAG TPA: TonB-dependent receptor [Thermoanaerobaculia bacterium]
MKLRHFALAALLAALVSSPALLAQAAAQISGRVVTPGGSPVPDARVTVIELRRSVRTDADGAFRVDGVAPGAYLLEVDSPRYGHAVERVQAASDAAPVTVTLDLTAHQERVVVSANPEARALAETYQPVQVVDAEELTESMQPTLGESLTRQPGVNSTYFGPGASRPVIRGFEGDRIRILESGIGVGDASSTSPDHAVSVDPLEAEKIEILRGPATLLYGSNAVGGVVNVIDSRIPERLSTEPFSGTVNLGYGSNGDQRFGGAHLDGRVGSIGLHGEIFGRATHDFEIPGHAILEEPGHEEEEEEEEHAEGILENSRVESNGYSFGASLVGDAGFIGAAFTRFDSLYGIPPGAHEHHEEEEEASARAVSRRLRLAPRQEEEGLVSIDMRQERWDVRGELARPFLLFKGAKLRYGHSDYEHAELEAPASDTAGAEIGTQFFNDYDDFRLELPQKTAGILSGSVGLQVSARDFVAEGEEAFVPPSQTDNWALFAVEELALSPSFRIQLGARWENQDTSALPADAESIDRDFDALSFSGGLAWLPASDWTIAFSITSANKFPNAEELFANGPHAATQAFEVGDPNLRVEESLGYDLSVRRTSGRLSGEVSFFYSDITDFIYLNATGEEEDDLPVFAFLQADAEFVGGEAHVDFDLIHEDPNHLTLEVGGDYVRAELSEGGDLPRIPALRYWAGLRYGSPRWYGSVEVRRTEEQDRVAENETPTPGYTFLNALIGYRLFIGTSVAEIFLRGVNLTDEEARNHISFLKDVAPLPGTDVTLGMRVAF